MKKNWEIYPQNIRDLFFRLRFILKLSVVHISKYLDIGKSTLYRWIKEGPLKPINITRTINFRTKIDKKYHIEIINYILKENTVSLKDICKYIFCKFKIKVSIPTIHRFCIRNNITYKKGSVSYSEADPVKKKHFLQFINSKNIKNIAFLDEACFLMNHSKNYGRSKKNKRTIIARPGQRGQRHSLLLCISSKGVIKWNLYSGSVDSTRFSTFLETINLPNKFIILDNARIHHASGVLTKQNKPTISEIASKHSLFLHYLPPYSPQLNPVEYCFNIIRTFVNRECPRTPDSLKYCIKNAIKTLTTNICNSVVIKALGI